LPTPDERERTAKLYSPNGRGYGYAPRVDDFLRNIQKPPVRIPDSTEDFGMYRSINVAFEGVHDYLEGLRRNQGRIGYTAQNLMSDLSKAYIEAAKRDDMEEMAYLDNDMQKLTEGLDRVSDEGEISEVGNRFTRTNWQERLEADLFGDIWPVITDQSDMVPALTSWEDFQGNIQAYIYGFLDVVPELGKALTEELSKPDLTTERELDLFRRYLVIAESITLRLSEERHIPGYVISNGYGRWMSFSTKLRTAYGTIAHVRREYNVRLSIQRMIKGAIRSPFLQKDEAPERYPRL
ncbi:MAG: hypothetical protein Q8P37_00005, partial [Candidatus Spechtbacteria bacterium]|nr:hypothetical protein [Candidatus Spechtbacteria bacterium]